MKRAPFVRRSVSPFGMKPVEKDYFDLLKEEIDARCPDLLPQDSNQLELFQDIGRLPAALRTINRAPANDCPQLLSICDYLVKQSLPITGAGLFDPVFNAMKLIFDRKTEIFLVDHHDKNHCAKMGWKEESRDVVLFSEERNILVGRFFEPITKDQPGYFSKFITEWSETDNLDRLLHFIDFCANLSLLTFEFYLLGTHPALARVIRNKDAMRSIVQKCDPLLKKIKSPTWEKDVLKALAF